ncbi:MAG: hypothetical protein DMF85_14495 [Acidobacteria bacterium]|nr:MAG: hypothetical protein DMF85_14495 [Acidobacteriota bacterium]
MNSHVNLLGILHVVWGGMGLLIGGAALLLATGAAAIARTTSGDPIAAVFTGFMFLTFATALLAGGWANTWAGRAVRRHQSAGRTIVLVLAVFNLFVLPFGTALAVYTFWVLLHNETRALFEPTPAA